MRYDIVPNKLFSFPSIWNDAEDWMSSFSNNGLSISEDDQHIYVEAAVPGVDPKDVDITFENDTLWIKAESKQEEKEGKKYYRRLANSYSYRVAVPGDIDQNSEPEAAYKHGVMIVTFQKAPKAQPKKIQVKESK